jgi:hypothetical protein
MRAAGRSRAARFRFAGKRFASVDRPSIRQKRSWRPSIGFDFRETAEIAKLPDRTEGAGVE